MKWRPAVGAATASGSPREDRLVGRRGPRAGRVRPAPAGCRAGAGRAPIRLEVARRRSARSNSTLAPAVVADVLDDLALDALREADRAVPSSRGGRASRARSSGGGRRRAARGERSRRAGPPRRGPRAARCGRGRRCGRARRPAREAPGNPRSVRCDTAPVRAIEHEEAARPARPRLLRDPVRRQEVVEEVGAQELSAVSYQLSVLTRKTGD